MKNNFIKKIYWFTLVELLVSVIISVLVLGGVFYLVGDVLLTLSRSSAQWAFLDDFYEFTTVLETGKLEDISSGSGFDIWILTSADGQNGILIWILNQNTMRLASVWESDVYGPYIFWYALLSSSQIQSIESDISYAYGIEFQGDKIFKNFFVKSFDIIDYNSWAIHDINIEIFPIYSESKKWWEWSKIWNEDIVQYTLTF